MPAARPLRSARWWRCHPTSLPSSYQALVEAALGRLTSSARGRTGSSRSFLRLARRYEEFLHLVRLNPVVLNLGLRRRSSMLVRCHVGAEAVTPRRDYPTMNGPAAASTSSGVKVGLTASGKGDSPCSPLRYAAWRASTPWIVNAAVSSSS